MKRKVLETSMPLNTTQNYKAEGKFLTISRLKLWKLWVDFGKIRDVNANIKLTKFLPARTTNMSRSSVFLSSSDRAQIVLKFSYHCYCSVSQGQVPSYENDVCIHGNHNPLGLIMPSKCLVPDAPTPASLPCGSQWCPHGSGRGLLQRPSCCALFLPFIYSFFCQLVHSSNW